MLKPINQSINRSINQSINHLFAQMTDKLLTDAAEC